jgi:hypothetical protein
MIRHAFRWLFRVVPHWIRRKVQFQLWHDVRTLTGGARFKQYRSLESAEKEAASKRKAEIENAHRVYQIGHK